MASRTANWSFFYSSLNPNVVESADAITSIDGTLFLRNVVFDEQKQPIRVTSSNKIESLIAESIFSHCYSDEAGGAIYFYLSEGDSVIYLVCGYDCFSNLERPFGTVTVGENNSNLLNLTSFVMCSSGNQGTSIYGSITMLQGVQCANNVNVSSNKSTFEGGIIFNLQTNGSRVMNLICTRCLNSGTRILYAGVNSQILSCTLVRCRCSFDLIYFRENGEMIGCNIVDCQTDCVVKCNKGVTRIFDVYSNINLKVNPEEVLIIRHLSNAVIHPHQMLETFVCWNGPIFPYTRLFMRRRKTFIISYILNSLLLTIK